MEIEELSPSHIKKLGHPLKEIRERALKLLLAKLKLGWKMENELSTTRELLDLLLAWFHVEKPTLQREALLLLLRLIETDAGNHVIKEFGIKKLISSLYSFKHQIEPNTEELFNEIIDILGLLNPTKSEIITAIPELNLPSVSSSSCEKDINTEVKNWNDRMFISQDSKISNSCDANPSTTELQDGITILLFPWVHLCPSDIKTLRLVEDNFRLLNSTQRCCRFIRDVFLRDFPPEIFLNRPSIIQSLLMIINDASSLQVYEALHLLTCITKSLHIRLHQLLCSELVDMSKSTDIVKSFIGEDGYQEELKNLTEDSCHHQNETLDDVDPVLKQLPVPVYVLDSLHTLLSTMIRNVILEEPFKKKDAMEMMELHMSALIVENLVKLLLDCVSAEFWKFEHSSKTQRDIAHKSCMAMRLLADLLNKYQRSCTEDYTRWHHRTTWLRLIYCAEGLMSWAHQSFLPSALVLALQAAQIDPALDVLYPNAAQKINNVLETPNISYDQEFARKYQEFCKLTICLKYAVQFMKNIALRSSKKLLTVIKQSLLSLEVHQSETYVHDIAEILFAKLKKWNMDDTDWNLARAIALRLMAHNCSWVQISFYKKMFESVSRIFSDGNDEQSDKEKDLYLLCDVGILTELCCQGLSSPIKQLASNANDIMVYLLRGRLLLSDSVWWRLLASVLPILPLLHCYAAHETSLGQAICKTLEVDIAECMGIPHTEVVWGLVRLLYVKCPMVQMDAAFHLCQLLDDEKYLPQKELLRSDVLVNALRAVQTNNFNVDTESSSSKLTQINPIIQIMDVLKQDIVINENSAVFTDHYRSHPVLEPSVRLSTLQQLSVLMRDPYSHETFIKHAGLQITICFLRMALSVDDYSAFPDCALCCISILNSVCYNDRHSLAKITDLPFLLLRAILIFPSKDCLVAMASQVLSVTAWAGFALQELDRQRKRVVALPKCVSENTTLPFPVQTYWSTSPNAVHSNLEWLLSEECWRSALRVRWACAWSGGARILRDFSSSPTLSAPPGPLSLQMTPDDMALLQSACPLRATTRALITLQNATSHNQVMETIATLEGYIYLIKASSISIEDLAALPWNETMARFLTAAPASPRDVTLLISLLKFILHYAQNVSDENNLMKWIITSFMESNDGIITLLSRQHLFPQQSGQEDIEIIQLHKHIVKVLLQCVIVIDRDDIYDGAKIVSLFKILLCCLEKVNLKDFHMLGYLNEVVRCLKYIANSRHFRPGEALIIQSFSQINNVVAKCGGTESGYKGQACRLDAMLTTLALIRRAHDENIPIQRWSESWSEAAVRAVCACCSAGRPELRAASLRLLATFAHYTQLLPHLQQAVPGQSLCKYALRIFIETGEADVVRAAAAALLSALCTRSSPYTNVYERNICLELEEHRFLDCCLEILADFSSAKEYKHQIERNVPISVIDNAAELEVRASKVNVSIQPSSPRAAPHAPSPGLVSALAGCLYNICNFPECPTTVWNERGLFRLLFRCTWHSEGMKNLSATSVSVMCTNARRVLCRFAQADAGVRATLANTRDCMHALLYTLRPLTEKETSVQLYEEYAQGLQLLGTLLMDVPAAKSVWTELKNGYADAFFSLISQSLETENLDFRVAGLYCLTQLMQCMEQCNADASGNSLKEFLDSIPVPQTLEGSVKHTEVLDPDGLDSGAHCKEVADCQPDYMVQTFCKSLIYIYRTAVAGANKVHLSKDETWTRICSCLASVLCYSVSAKAYAVHAGFPQTLLASLQTARDHLNVHGKPADIIRNSNSDPVLRTLYWILTMMNSSMTDYQAAKESFAENNNIANSLNKLWPWFMMTEELREAAMCLLQTFTNNCPKALVCMCACVGGRNLVVEVCALAQREAALASRPHPPHLLVAALDTLTHCTHHHHCRAIMLKTDIIAVVYRVRCTERGRHAPLVWGAWTRLASAASRHADGAARLLGLRAPTPAPSRELLLPALAHAAHHHRATFLQSADLLDLVCAALMSGDPAQVVPAARAVWALAANNHKAKMTLRSAGVSAAVSCALQRLQRSRSVSELLDRAFHLLAYTDSILNIS